MITVFIGLGLGVFIGFNRSHYALAAAIAFVIGAAGHLAIGSVAEIAVTRPPVILWENWIAAACRSSPYWFTGAAAAAAATLTSRLLNPPEYQWVEGEPDRRTGTERRSGARVGPDRRGALRA